MNYTCVSMWKGLGNGPRATCSLPASASCVVLAVCVWCIYTPGSDIRCASRVSISSDVNLHDMTSRRGPTVER
jgi:hypothetical protein